MRSLASPRCLSLLLVAWTALLGDNLQAQEPVRVEISKVELGYRRSGQSTDRLFKSGLWAPVYVTFGPTSEGGMKVKPQKDGFVHGKLHVESTDNDENQQIYTVPFSIDPRVQTTVLTYTTPGSQHPELRITAEIDGVRQELSERGFGALELNDYLYLTLGSRLPVLEQTLKEMTRNSVRADGKQQAPGAEEDDVAPKLRHLALETKASRLPKQWFGYQGVDVIFLLTSDEEFLKQLLSSEAQLGALATWVQRGGRLIVSVSWENKETVARLLTVPQWQPALPGMLVADRSVELTDLLGVLNWTKQNERTVGPAVTRKAPLRVPALRALPQVEVLIKEEVNDGTVPLMVRAPYGLGHVLLLALDMEKEPLKSWPGKIDFHRTILSDLTPTVQSAQNQEGKSQRSNDYEGTDLGSRLQQQLDHFNVPMISFGWVAFFILLYILIVGPLDYLLLKRVFKRLEWTWFTFPTVVVVVSVLAYFTAYAIKGSDLKINKVDVVDIDLRTALDAELKPASAQAIGQSWFCLLSPQIKSYTIGVEPALDSWGKDFKTKNEPTMVNWLGRPEARGPGAFGRQSSQGLFRRAYNYAPDATGLEGVPIPVWTTKSFTAAWQTTFARLPFTVDLSYDAKSDDRHVAGTLTSNLAVELQDVYLFLNRQYFQLGKLAPEQKLKVDLRVAHTPNFLLENWFRTEVLDDPLQRSYRSDRGTEPFAPYPLFKDLYFHESRHAAGRQRNHLMRTLDQSWRLREKDVGVRTAILVARLPRVEGDTEKLHASREVGLPTHLWLDQLPAPNRTRPELKGTLVQETYVRLILPVRPK